MKVIDNKMSMMRWGIITISNNEGTCMINGDECMTRRTYGNTSDITFGLTSIFHS